MGQTIITAGLLVIVTIAVINAHRLVVTAETSKLEAIARLESADLAMALITEARMKKYDENEVTTSYQATTAFTVHTSLGRDAGESVNNPDVEPFLSAQRFDDFDDYKNYRRRANTLAVTGYILTCQVYYATPDAPDTEVTTRTYVKTLEVRVSHSLYLPTPITVRFTRTY